MLIGILPTEYPMIPTGIQLGIRLLSPCDDPFARRLSSIPYHDVLPEDPGLIETVLRTQVRLKRSCVPDFVDPRAQM